MPYMINILKGKDSSKLSKEEVYDFLNSWLKEQIDVSQRVLISEEPFSKLAYSEFIAYHLGTQKAYSKLLDLIPLTKGKDEH